MPTVDSHRTRNRQILIAGLGLLALSVLSYAVCRRIFAHPENKPASIAQVSTATNVTINPTLVAPGTVVSAEGVLEKLDKWHAAHPNYHSILTTTYPNGSVISKTEIFAFTNNNEAIVKFKSQVYALTPNLEFLGAKENGKLQVYFPRSNLLLEPNMADDLLFMPNMPGNFSAAKDMLKIARSSFAEASTDMEIATLAVRSETFKVPHELTGDVFISFRINTEGKLLSIEEQAQGQQFSLNMKYLSFDRELVMRDAPVMPTGMIAITNKTFMKTMQEEVENAAPKPLNHKI